MTRVLKLVRGSVELDLLNDMGVHLRSGEDNWRPVYPMAVAHGDPEPVVETMRLMCKGTSQDALAGTMQMWADMMQGAANYRTDANGTQPVWLHAKLDNETGERRSIVHQIDAAWVDSGISDVVDANYVLFDAAIERGPYWERPTPTAMGTMVYTNLLTNGNFATAGTGGVDVFGTWVESAGDGAIANSSGQAQLTSGATRNTKIAQTVTVAAETMYQLSFQTESGGAGHESRYGIYDVTNSADIVAITGSGVGLDGAMESVILAFRAPEACTSLRVDLWCSNTNGETVYFDNVYLTALLIGGVTVYDYTANGGADVVGDVPARIAPLVIGQYGTVDARRSADIDKMWVGARSEARHPGLASFEPVWECEQGQAGVSTAGTALTDASGYYATSAMRVTPGSADWQSRVTGMNTAAALGPAQFGDYLWLLRAKVSSGTYEMKLRWSTSNAHYIEGPAVEITNTSFLWKEMGISSIPLVNRQIMDTTVFPDHAYSYVDYHVDIYAARTAGSGTLDLDCLGLLPIDEGFIAFSDLNWAAGTALAYAVYSESPHGALAGVVINNAHAVFEATDISGQLHAPPGDGRLYLFTNGTATASLTHYFNFLTDDATKLTSSQYYPRWLSLRGAE